MQYGFRLSCWTEEAVCQVSIILYFVLHAYAQTLLASDMK